VSGPMVCGAALRQFPPNSALPWGSCVCRNALLKEGVCTLVVQPRHTVFRSLRRWGRLHMRTLAHFMAERDLQLFEEQHFHAMELVWIALPARTEFGAVLSQQRLPVTLSADAGARALAGVHEDRRGARLWRNFR